jgi:hypothetical protein
MVAVWVASPKPLSGTLAAMAQEGKVRKVEVWVVSLAALEMARLQ